MRLSFEAVIVALDLTRVHRSHLVGPSLEMTTPVEVLIVCPFRLYREGLASAMRSRGAGLLDVVATAAGLAEALEVVGTRTPRVLLLDASVSDLWSGIRSLTRAVPDAALLAFGVDESDEERRLALLDAGCCGYVSDTASFEELQAGVLRAASGDMSSSRPPDQTRLAPLAEHGLTRREIEVLELIERGLSNKGIGNALSIRLPTVKNHVHNILTKLGVSRRSEAAAALRRTRRALTDPGTGG